MQEMINNKSKLHPGYMWVLRLGCYSLDIIGFGLLMFFTHLMIPSFMWLMILAFCISLIIIDICIGLYYNRWFFEFTNNNLKIEKGVIWKNYNYIPYEKIQNVDIKRGILARLFGFSSIKVHTAGYSGESGAEGYIPAIDTKLAIEIKDYLMNKDGREKR